MTDRCICSEHRGFCPPETCPLIFRASDLAATQKPPAEIIPGVETTDIGRATGDLPTTRYKMLRQEPPARTWCGTSDCGVCDGCRLHDIAERRERGTTPRPEDVEYLLRLVAAQEPPDEGDGRD